MGPRWYNGLVGMEGKQSQQWGRGTNNTEPGPMCSANGLNQPYSLKGVKDDRDVAALNPHSMGPCSKTILQMRWEMQGSANITPTMGLVA